MSLDNGRLMNMIMRYTADNTMKALSNDAPFVLFTLCLGNDPTLGATNAFPWIRFRTNRPVGGKIRRFLRNHPQDQSLHSTEWQPLFVRWKSINSFISIAFASFEEFLQKKANWQKNDNANPLSMLYAVEVLVMCIFTTFLHDIISSNMC